MAKARLGPGWAWVSKGEAEDASLAAAAPASLSLARRSVRSPGALALQLGSG